MTRETTVAVYRPEHQTSKRIRQRWNSKTVAASFTNASQFDDYSLARLRGIHQELLTELCNLKEHDKAIKLANLQQGNPKSACAESLRRIAYRRTFLVGLANHAAKILQRRNQALRENAKGSYERCLIDACRELLSPQQFDLVMSLAKEKHALLYELIYAQDDS